MKVPNNKNYVLEWESKGISDESIKPPATTDNIFNPLLEYGNKLKLKFNGSSLKQDNIAYNHGTLVKSYVVHEISRNFNTSSYSALENCLVAVVSLTKRADIDQYNYSGYGIGYDRKGLFSLPSCGTGSNVMIFGVEMNLSTKINNGKKYTLIIGEGPTQGLEHVLSAEKMYSINFTEDKNVAWICTIM